MRIKLFIFLVFLVSNSYAQSETELKENFKQLLKQQKLSGALWATVSNDGAINTDAWGYKNTRTKELLSSTDKIHVGSVSKTILAAGFLRMATLGMLDLDDTVQQYLPNLPLENKWANTNPVLIRHLLDHTSGLTDVKLWHVFSTTATPDTPLDTFFHNDPEILKVQARPGSIYSYSNLGYTILGLIIESITRQRYENYLDENLLKPLGMTNSTFHFVSQTGAYQDKQLAYGHLDRGEPIAAVPNYLRPAGQFTTTVYDIGRFLRFMMSDGTVNGKRFISVDYLKSVGQQKGTAAYKFGVPYGDALGAYSRDRYGTVGIAKNGNTLGFSSMLYFFPAEKKAFFVAFNKDNETANYDLFNELLVQYLDLGKRPYVTRQKNIENELKNWNGYFVPVIEKVQPFGFLDYIFSYSRVEVSKTGATIVHSQGKIKKLIYQGKHLFSMRDRTAVSHSFYKATGNNLMITDGVKTIRKISGLKILGVGASIFLGVTGIIYVFLLGCINLLKYKFNYIKQPSFWTFLPIILLTSSCILVSNQSIMFLGDKTVGNYFMAWSTALLPIFSLVSVCCIIAKQKKYLQTCSFWAILFVLQFCVLLSVNSLIPLVLWK